MPGVTKEQIRQAREADLFAYLERHERGVLKRDGPNYRHREHDSLVYVTAKNYWYWNSRGKRINALDYLMEIRGYGLVEAVNALAGPAMQYSFPSRSYQDHAAARQARKPDRCYLPWQKKCATSYVSYLQKRGISTAVIKRCTQLGIGNWLNQNDRQASLNMGFEALKDLAATLHISDKDIAYQGTLAIAFGARGSGNAAAHYEPLRKVINLTKMHGAGSLAHEWWHGLDDYLGGKMGAKGFLSDNAHLYPPMKKLIDAMKFKAETPEQAAKRAEVKNARLVKQAEAWADSAMKYAVDRYGDDAVKEQYASLKAAFVSGEPGSVDKLSDLKKTISGHVIPKSERDQLHNYERIMREIKENPQPTPGKTPTDYYRNSKKMGENCASV